MPLPLRLPAHTLLICSYNASESIREERVAKSLNLFHCCKQLLPSPKTQAVHNATWSHSAQFYGSNVWVTTCHVHTRFWVLYSIQNLIQSQK